MNWLLGEPATGKAYIARAMSEQEVTWHEALRRFAQRRFRFVDNSWRMEESLFFDSMLDPLLPHLQERIWMPANPAPPCDFQPQLTPDWTGP